MWLSKGYLLLFFILYFSTCFLVSTFPQIIIYIFRVWTMAFKHESLHKLARLNYFKHTPDVVVVGGISTFVYFIIGNGFVGRCACRIAAQSGLIPVSISVDPTPPVYGEDSGHIHSWVTRVFVLLHNWHIDAMAWRRCNQTIYMGSSCCGSWMYCTNYSNDLL